MNDRALADLATRAGVDRSFVERLVELGILPAPTDADIAPGAVRRVRVLDSLERGGISLEIIAQASRSGAFSLDFVDQPSYNRFAGEEDVTFAELSSRTAVPLDLLLVVREAMGSARPGPDDRLREDELTVVPWIRLLLDAGVRPELVERTLRVAGDGMRRLADTEADWFRSEILAPLFRAGLTATEVGAQTARFANDVGPLTDVAITAVYHGQQAHAWMRNIFEGFESQLAAAGLRPRLDRPPAICFFDVSGYSTLTEERGDAEAADLAGRFARLVQRLATERGGTAIKWLGDGVMLHFGEPAAAVLAALDMLDRMTREGLPPGHAGVHAGPVLFQEGDYFGRTVNTAARIAAHAGRGQLLVSNDVVLATVVEGVAFEPIGPVELKGLLAPIELFAAHRVADA